MRERSPRWPPCAPWSRWGLACVEGRVWASILGGSRSWPRWPRCRCPRRCTAEPLLEARNLRQPSMPVSPTLRRPPRRPSPPQVPPLRVRPSDVRTMQAFFLKRVAQEKGLESLTLSDDAVRGPGARGQCCKAGRRQGRHHGGRCGGRGAAADAVGRRGAGQSICQAAVRGGQAPRGAGWQASGPGGLRCGCMADLLVSPSGPLPCTFASCRPAPATAAISLLSLPLPSPPPCPQIRQLQAYSYPFNITELRNMVERAAAQVGHAAARSVWPHGLRSSHLLLPAGLRCGVACGHMASKAAGGDFGGPARRCGGAGAALAPAVDPARHASAHPPNAPPTAPARAPTSPTKPTGQPPNRPPARPPPQADVAQGSSQQLQEEVFWFAQQVGAGAGAGARGAAPSPVSSRRAVARAPLLALKRTSRAPAPLLPSRAAARRAAVQPAQDPHGPRLPPLPLLARGHQLWVRGAAAAAVARGMTCRVLSGAGRGPEDVGVGWGRRRGAWRGPAGLAAAVVGWFQGPAALAHPPTRLRPSSPFHPAPPPSTLHPPPPTCAPPSFTVYAFALLVGLLFLGPQDRWVGRTGQREARPRSGSGSGCRGGGRRRRALRSAPRRPVPDPPPPRARRAAAPATRRSHNFGLNLFW